MTQNNQTTQMPDEIWMDAEGNWSSDELDNEPGQKPFHYVLQVAPPVTEGDLDDVLKHYHEGMKAGYEKAKAELQPPADVSEDERCEAGCKAYHGGEIRHHKDCVFYPESLSEMYDKKDIEIQFQRAELKHLYAAIKNRDKLEASRAKSDERVEDKIEFKEYSAEYMLQKMPAHNDHDIAKLNWFNWYAMSLRKILQQASER